MQTNHFHWTRWYLISWWLSNFFFSFVYAWNFSYAHFYKFFTLSFLLTHFSIISFFYILAYILFYLGNENYVCTIWETCFLLILSLFFLASFCKDHGLTTFFKATTLVNRSTQTENSCSTFLFVAAYIFFLSELLFSPNMWAF